MESNEVVTENIPRYAENIDSYIDETISYEKLSLPFSLYYQLRGVFPYQLTTDGHSQRERVHLLNPHQFVQVIQWARPVHTEEKRKSNRIDGCNDLSLHSGVTRTVRLSPGIQIRQHFVPLLSFIT